MARDGSGTYNLPEAAFVNGNTIDADAVNNNFTDIATALTGSVSADGQTTIVADLPMAGYKHTGVANGSARTHYGAIGQIQDSAFTWCGTASGTANALTIAPSPSITVYATGQTFAFFAASATTTTTPTLAVSGLTAKSLKTFNGSALYSGQIAAGDYIRVVYDGTYFRLVGNYGSLADYSRALTWTGIQEFGLGWTVGGSQAPTTDNTAGAAVAGSGIGRFSADGNIALDLNRKSSDGAVINVRQDGTTEGTVSVSGTTVTWGSFCGAHWAQLADGTTPDIPRGTLMETIDQMCAWPGEDNDQLVRVQVSQVAASRRVLGVFFAWSPDEVEQPDGSVATTNDQGDMLVAGLGAYLIRMQAGQVVAGGDLVESAGDGTARVQADDLMRAATVGKITAAVVIETYADGSYLVPCTLHCG